jgi:hypothetical protein
MSSTADDAPTPAGHARLVVATDGHVLAGSPAAAGVQEAFALDADRVSIGSADTQDIRLAGLEPEHGVIQRDGDADEWVYRDLHANTASRVDGAVVAAAGLHHGDRLQLGDVTLVFQRDEDADHGRPDGGRQGGDFAGGGSAGGGGETTEQG